MLLRFLNRRSPLLVVVLVLLVVVLPVLLVLVPFAAAAAVIKGSGGNGRRACSGVTCDHDVLRRCAMATDCPARAAIGYVEPISSEICVSGKKPPTVEGTGGHAGATRAEGDARPPAAC